MNYFIKLFQKTKTQPDVWFFYAFLLSFSFSVRKVWFYFPVQGTFNEYTGIYVYISDIFLFLTMLSWSISLLCNESSILSNYRLWITRYLHKLYRKIKLESRFIFYNHLKNKSELVRDDELANIKDSSIVPRLPRETKLFHVEQFSFLRGGTYAHRALFILPLILVFWSFVSILWSANQNIAIFRSIKLIEYYLLYLYIAFRIVLYIKNNCSTPAPLVKIVPRGTILTFTGWNNLTLIIMFIGLFQSLIGIFQVIIQHSIGFFWLKESLITPDIAGVAKFVINGQKYIRAYGLFPHPNILGGFLLLSIIITLLYKKMFHMEHKIVPRGTILNIIIAIQTLALLLTFSKSAIIGLIIALLYLYVPRGTIRNKLRQNYNLRIIFLAFAIIFLILYLLWPMINPMIYNSIEQRMLYLNVSPARIAMQSVAGGRGTIGNFQTLFFGIGQGQFVWNMQKYKIFETWQFQPVHNVFLLIWSELGIVGLSLFVYWLYKIFNYSKSILDNKYTILSSSIVLRYFKAILLGFLFIMLFDHYFWDIQQGSFLFWMTMGVIAGIKK